MTQPATPGILKGKKKIKEFQILKSPRFKYIKVFF